MSSAIAKKMLEASKSIGHIEKGGFNAHFKFKFQAWDDVLPAIRDALAEVGLWIIPSATMNSRIGDVTTVDLTFQIIDTDTGETMIATWVGEGKDGQDKGVQKAGTSGTKYWFLKAFQIPCEGVEDTDALAPETKEKAKPAQVSKADVKTPETNGETPSWAKSIILVAGEFENPDDLKLWWKPLMEKNVSIVHFAKIVTDRGLKGRAAIDSLAKEHLAA